MKTISTIMFMTAFMFTVEANSIIESLMGAVDKMAENDNITLDYTFEGCFGPYHRGSIEMKMKDDTIYYTNHSYDGNSSKPFTQAGKYDKSQLMRLLEEQKKNIASDVLGNTIDYKIKSSKMENVHGSDRIEQRNFIALFHPLTSFFKPENKSIIPKLSTGGFVH